MGQASAYLRRAKGGYSHWCPGCGEMHLIPDSWTFDGNVDKPTFTPSVKITGKQRIIVDGEWAGGWVRGPDGNAIDCCCHYNLTAGQLVMHGDSTHALKGQTVALPELPEGFRDT
jgi:hypothetical protein